MILLLILTDFSYTIIVVPNFRFYCTNIETKTMSEGETEFQRHIRMLKNNDPIHSTVIFNNEDIDDNQVAELGEALQANTHVFKVELQENKIGLEGVKSLTKVVKDKETIQVVNLAGNKIGAEGGKEVAQMLRECKSLEELRLGGNELGDDGAREIAHALQEANGSLRILSLDNNSIGDDGTKELASVLTQDDSLPRIDLSNNKIGDQGTMAISDMLKHNNKLLNINLSSNDIDEQGAQALIDAMRDNNATMTMLRVDGNDRIGEGLTKEINDLCERNTRGEGPGTNSPGGPATDQGCSGSKACLIL